MEEQPKEQIAIEEGAATAEQVEEILEGKYCTIKEIATKLGFSPAYISKLCKQGTIKAVKPLQGHWRVPLTEAERIMKEGIPPMPRVKVEKEPVTYIEVSREQQEKIAPQHRERQEVSRRVNPYWPLPFPLRSNKKEKE